MQAVDSGGGGGAAPAGLLFAHSQADRGCAAVAFRGSLVGV